MYLFECVGVATAVEIPASSRSLSSSSTLSTQQSSRVGTKIPVPSRHQPGGGGAAAATAAAAIAASACTPEEIYCYTQFEPNYSARFTRFPSTVHADMGPVHHLEEARMMTTLAADIQNGPGRPDRLEEVMSLHPQYMKIFSKSQAFIMRGDGPLPFHYRHYIAIMAAGRHQCSYLIEQQVSEFLQQGGDERWLQGLHCIPTKLRDLYEVNKILAHRPWLITKNHIEKLTKGSDSWSLGELVHALVILSHFHAISSFVFGSGIGDGEEEPPCLSQSPGRTSPVLPPAGSPTSSSPLLHQPEESYIMARAMSSAAAAISVGSNPGSRNGSARGSPESSFRLSSSSNASSRRSTMSDLGPDHEVGLDALMRRMKNLAERRQEFSAEEQTKRYEHVENQSAELGVSPSPAQGRPKPEISQFIYDPDFTYQDFARRGEVNLIPTFRVQDYSWDDHAYSLINRLYNDVGNLLDDKFRLMYQLTYNTMGSKKDVDTSRFRTAIWNYIQCMFGIRHDDYDYGEVNQVLERSLKAYIKMTVCFPERVTRSDYDSVLKEFHHSEKIHVNLMLLEARVQAELLYALRAIMRHMT